MITLLTGLPGNGKTLFALWYIKAKSEREGRPVYYHNIKDLTLPWTLHDPEKWMDLPPNSIMVIDEAQQVFPKKPNGAMLPAHYNELATHRHKGIDIYLITQHPSLIDNFARQLVGQHFHTIRKFGLNRSTVYEWSAANPSPASPASMKSAITLKWAYPKEVFTYYKSAEVHTVKRSIPPKLILAVVFLIVVAYFAYTRLGRVGEKPDAAPPPQAAASAGPNSPAGTAAPGQTASPEFDPVADARHWVQQQTPRVAGLPQTAPKYDQLTVPVRVPVPAACIQIGNHKSEKGIRCKCYTQQGTPMDVEFNMCISIAQNGHFQDFDADPRQQAVAQAEKQARGVEVMSRVPDTPAPSWSQQPVVVSMSGASGISDGSHRATPTTVRDDGPPNPRSRFALANQGG